MHILLYKTKYILLDIPVFKKLARCNLQDCNYMELEKLLAKDNTWIIKNHCIWYADPLARARPPMQINWQMNWGVLFFSIDNWMKALFEPDLHPDFKFSAMDPKWFSERVDRCEWKVNIILCANKCWWLGNLCIKHIEFLSHIQRFISKYNIDAWNIEVPV